MKLLIKDLVDVCAAYGAVIFPRTDGKRQILSVRHENVWLDFERIDGKGAEKLRSSPHEPSPHREAFAWLYQWAGAMNAPVSILDNLSALAQGEPLPHEWQYPAMPDERTDENDSTK